MAVGESSGRLLARARDDLPGFFSLLVFFGVTALLFRSVEFALIVTASLGFHELGHAAALRVHRLQWRISFSAAGAMTWSSLAERTRLSQLSNAYVHLAGPLFSLLLALAALGLHAAWQPESRHLLILANFSAQVGFLNLLPLGAITDGGKAFQRMVHSVRGQARKWAVVLPFAATAVMLTLYALVEWLRYPATSAEPLLLGLLLVSLWMAAGLVVESWRTKPGKLPPTQPMTASQVFLLLLLVWDMLVFYLIVIYATPFWLAPEYLLGMLENITVLLEWVVRLLFGI
jgi:hypothetical protein